MSKVNIAFKGRFRTGMIEGIKTQTARVDRMGNAGDFFEAFGHIFRITSVTQEPLSVVADAYTAEGCLSRLDFMTVWKEIHPRKGFDPAHAVYVHRFHHEGTAPPAAPVAPAAAPSVAAAGQALAARPCKKCGRSDVVTVTLPERGGPQTFCIPDLARDKPEVAGMIEERLSEALTQWRHPQPQLGATR